MTIVNTPSQGTATTNNDGTITYTPTSLVNGTDSFTYTVNNSFGQTSNEATVTLELICAGDNASVNLCA